MKYLILFILLSSCAVTKTEKAYICYEVFSTTNSKIVHRFANLTLTEGRDEDLDSAIFKPMDTVLIKDYRRIFRKRTVFILKK